jgi:hypothetical protein
MPQTIELVKEKGERRKGKRKKNKKGKGESIWKS